MSGATADQIGLLSEPTPREEIKKRPVFNKNKEKVGELDYVDARFIMDRLDAAVGPTNWQVQTREVAGGIVCRLGILVARESGAEWVWKEDVGTESTIEETKGSYSDAIKRAAVHWGIARDLYDTREGGKQVQPAAGQSTTQVRAQTGRPRNWAVPVAEAPWSCPDHESVVVWPAGTSASGRAYDAFYACPKGRECAHRAPAGLKVKPEHLTPRASSAGSDDLPF